MRKLLTIAAISISAFFGFVGNAHGLTISPAKLEMYGDPGSTINGEFLLINEQGEGKTFYSSAENFEAQGETGTPVFVSSKDGLASWINVQPDVTLGKNEQQKIHFTISIPSDADAGGHFAAIFLSTAPPSDKDGQVSVGAKIGVLILLRVSGDIKEGGGVTRFDTANSKKFFNMLPVNFVYRFNNSGNDRTNPKGSIILKNVLGLTSDTLDANPTKGNILPGSTRKFDVKWGESVEANSAGFLSIIASQWNNFAFGPYKANLSLTYGNNGASESSTWIFVLPWQLLLVVLTIVLVVGFILITVIKRYNRWIIEKARGSI